MTTLEALTYFLGDHGITTDVDSEELRSALSQAGREAHKRRQEGPRATRAVLSAMRELGLSYREIERRTGIPLVTARRLVEGQRPPE